MSAFVSASTAGNQDVMSDDRPQTFLDMAFCGHARKTLPPEIVELVDKFAADLSEANCPPLNITTRRLFKLAMAVHDHAQARHAAFCEQLSGRLEGTADA